MMFSIFFGIILLLRTQYLNQSCLTTFFLNANKSLLNKTLSLAVLYHILTLFNFKGVIW